MRHRFGITFRHIQFINRPCVALTQPAPRILPTVWTAQCNDIAISNTIFVKLRLNAVRTSVFLIVVVSPSFVDLYGNRVVAIRFGFVGKNWDSMICLSIFFIENSRFIVPGFGHFNFNCIGCGIVNNIVVGTGLFTQIIGIDARFVKNQCIKCNGVAVIILCLNHLSAAVFQLKCKVIGGSASIQRFMCRDHNLCGVWVGFTSASATSARFIVIKYSRDSGIGLNISERRCLTASIHSDGIAAVVTFCNRILNTCGKIGSYLVLSVLHFEYSSAILERHVTVFPIDGDILQGKCECELLVGAPASAAYGLGNHKIPSIRNCLCICHSEPILAVSRYNCAISF